MNEIKRRFQATYGANVDNAIGYAMNSEFASVLANEMKHYSESHDVDTISKVHGELDELKNIMVKNIGKTVILRCLSCEVKTFILEQIILQCEVSD